MTSFAFSSAETFLAAPVQQRLTSVAATLIVADFLLDQLISSMTAHGGDLLEALVLAALSSGNCAHLPANRFAGPDGSPPDRERRAVTIRQVAETLRQPYETVRRRFITLEAAGIIVRRGRSGFIVTEAAERTPARREAARRAHGKVQRMIKSLQVLERRHRPLSI